MRLIGAKELRAMLLVLFVGLACSCGLVYGQGTSGSLNGQITDSTGAAIVGANVTLTNVGTNYVQSAKTDSTGVYQFKLVPPGNYSLDVSAPGFAAYSQNGIVMNANLYATQNLKLKVASAAGEVVTVTSNAQLIDTTTAELGMTVNQESVSQLPLAGRDPSSLALLAPGMVDAGTAGVMWAQSGFSFPGEAAASANGGRIGSTYYMLDGVTNMDNYLGSNSPTPNTDATQEFRLITNNFSAVYGFSTGGVVSMATRSGSNEWHGGLFEFMRNEDFNAGNWNNHKADKYRKNVFGGYVGGPALKNKLFFFFNYQGTDLLGGPGSTNNYTTTPTTQMMSGDFSGLIDYAQAHASNNGCGTGYNVATSLQTTSCGWLNGPFQTVNGKPNQLIGGASGLDPVAAQFTKDGLPGHAAAASGTANPTSGAQNLAGAMLYGSANLGNSKWNEYTSRVDFDMSKSQRLTVRSFIDKFVQPAGDTPGNVLSVLNLNNWSQTFGENMWYFNELLQHTWTINPTTVNTVTALWTQQSAHNGTPVVDNSGKKMCWSRYINISEPVCYMEGAYFGSANGGWTEPSQEVRGTMGFSDTLIKTIHRHTVSLGIDMVRQRAVEDAKNYPADAIIGFGGFTGNGTADWLLGNMNSFEQGAGELVAIQGWQIDPYVNDEFRMKPGLTLTLGVRWDPDFAPISAGGRGSAFVPGQHSIMFPNAPTGLVFPGDTGVNAALRPGSKYFFEPRIGVAYQPSSMPHTSFHAAFGMFSAPVPYSDYNHVTDVAPFSTTFSLSNPANKLSSVCAAPGTTTPINCVPNSGQAIIGTMNFHNPWSTSTSPTAGTSPFPPFASVSYKPPTNALVLGPIYEQDSFSRNFKAGMTQAWNASVEQQLGNTMAVRVAYVGSESYHQSYVQDDNFASYSYCTYYNNAACPLPTVANKNNGTLALATAPYSNFTGILEYDSGATASYHSLQATFQRHLAHGLQAQSSFTWQKTIDVASSANIAANQNGINNPANLRWNRGESSASIPFSWVSNFVYRSPELKGQSLLMREVLGGWEISPIATWQSGTPFSVGAGNSNSAYGEVGKGSGCLQFCSGDRADRVPGVPLKVRQGGRSNWTKSYFNTAAFTTRHDGTFGTSGRNIMHGPPGFSTDASLMKNWSILERYQLQFRFELYNAFNHSIMSNPDASPPVTNGGDGCAGQINCFNSGLGGPSNSTRFGQAALKLTF